MTHIEDRWVIRARELIEQEPRSGHEGDIHAALVLGQEMADARAEYIALKIDQRVNRSECIRNAYDEAITCAEIARSTIEKPKTRETVMEDALRRMKCTCSGQALDIAADFGAAHRTDCNATIAYKAITWKPHTERTPRPD